MAGKKRRQVQKMTPTKSEMSDEELESGAWKAKQVVYQVRDGTPRLKMRFGLTNRNVKWTPVIPSPVSSQTRSQTMNRILYLVGMDVHLLLTLCYCVAMSLPTGKIIIQKALMKLTKQEYSGFLSDCMAVYMMEMASVVLPFFLRLKWVSFNLALRSAQSVSLSVMIDKNNFS